MISDVMTKDIGTQIENAQLSKSNIVIENINEISLIMININQQGLVVMLNCQSGYHLKACINIKNEDQKCFKYCVQCSVFKIYERQPT